MNKVTNIYSKIAITVPMAVAAPASPAMNFTSSAIGARRHLGQQRRLSSPIFADGCLDSGFVDLSTLPCVNTRCVRYMASVSITPVFRPVVNNRIRWYVEDDSTTRSSSITYSIGWDRPSAAFGSRGYLDAKYVNRSDSAVSLRQDFFEVPRPAYLQRNGGLPCRKLMAFQGSRYIKADIWRKAQSAIDNIRVRSNDGMQRPKYVSSAK